MIAPLLIVCIALLGGFLGGVLGALTGLGGGIIVVPFLTLVLHFPIRLHRVIAGCMALSCAGYMIARSLIQMCITH